MYTYNFFLKRKVLRVHLNPFYVLKKFKSKDFSRRDKLKLGTRVQHYHPENFNPFQFIKQKYKNFMHLLTDLI